MPHSPMPLPSLIDREAFLIALAAIFPDIAGNISDIESGLLHPEMGVVSDATRTAIIARDWEAVAAHFQFISEVFSGGNDAVRNAVYVSYLENVLLGESSSEFEKARSMLPPLLGRAMLELEGHFERLSHANPRP